MLEARRDQGSALVYTCDVRDDVVKLQVHLHQGVLHVLDMASCVLDQPFPLTQIGAQGCYLGIRPKAAA